MVVAQESFTWCTRPCPTSSSLPMEVGAAKRFIAPALDLCGKWCRNFHMSGQIYQKHQPTKKTKDVCVCFERRKGDLATKDVNPQLN